MYLLQNWWKEKPYFEVDAEYFESAGATIHFVAVKQDKMGGYPSNYHTIVECSVDACENFIPEGLVEIV